MKLKFIESIRLNMHLIKMLTKREIESRYRGSMLGSCWAFINPMMMILVYTIVFSQVFQMRWSTSATNSSPVDYAINLFAGLIVFNMFAECITKAPIQIVSNPNFVKKIVFPIEILGVKLIGSAITHGVISLTLLCMIKIATTGHIPIKIMALPIVWTPFAVGLLGLTWLLNTIGVFLKDISQIVGSVASATMFLSPIFYPTSALPENLKFLGYMNPIGITIEQTRGVLINNTYPDITTSLLQLGVSILFCEASFRLMNRQKYKFSDEI